MTQRFKNYLEYAEHPVSEKITLAHVECKNRLYDFSQVDSTDVYSITTDHFVIKCNDGTTSLESVSGSGDVESGKYYYDIQDSILYVYSSGGFSNADTDPEIIPTYRLFFASAPINLSWDLNNTSLQVYYEPRIISSPGFSSSIDNDQTGISITGSGTLKLENGDLYFDDLYDLYFFENKEVTIFSYNRTLAPDEAKTIYRGKITDKTYSKKEVSFKVKDVIHSLNEAIPLGKFSDITDTVNISPEVGKMVKRRLYGILDGIRCQSVDMLWDEDSEAERFTLTSTISASKDTKIVTGSGFKNEVSPGDTLYFRDDNVIIDSVQNDTTMIVASEFEYDIASEEALIKPEKYYYNTNRKFLICGHPVYSLTTSVSGVIERNRVIVDDATGFKAGDYVEINGQYVSIKRISGNKFIFTQNLTQLPSVDDTITREKIQRVRVLYPDREFADNRPYKEIQLVRGDYSVSETTEGSYLDIEDDAEKNATQPRLLPGQYYYVYGYDMAWLGRPTIIRIDTAANTAGSLNGTYFTLVSDSKQVVFWFAEKLDSDQQQTEAPTFSYSVPASSISTANDTITYNSHGLGEGDQVSFEDSANLPAGITGGHSYYVREVTTNTFKISADEDSNIKDFTTQGSGTHTLVLTKEMYQITLSSNTLTSTQVASEVAVAISESIDTYVTKNSSNNVFAYTKKGEDITNGAAGDSGFTLYKLMSGLSSTQGISLPKEIGTRDYIKPAILADSAYQEVLQVFETSMKLRTTFAGTTGSYRSQVKNVGYVDNDSHIYVDLSGKVDDDDLLIYRASDIVKDLLVEGGLEDRLDTDSFDDSLSILPYTMSVKIPESFGDSAPTMKEVIDEINQTVLGSVVLIDELQIAYKPLDTERTSQDLAIIKDDDIISWTEKSTGNSYKEVVANYNFTDIETNPSSEYIFNSDFAEKYSDSILSLSLNLLTYSTEESIEVAQRRVFYNTLSRGDVVIRGPLVLAKHEMGDRVILDLYGHYNRLGNSVSRKLLGTVSSVTRNGESVDLTITNLGNVFNRIGVITEEDAPDFGDATEDEKIYCGYITDEDGSIENLPEMFGCNSIG